MHQELSKLLLEHLDTDESLMEEDKVKLRESIEKLGRGEALTEEAGLDLMDYSESVIKAIEDGAIAQGDSEAITKFAEMRTQRDQMLEAVLKKDDTATVVN